MKLLNYFDYQDNVYAYGGLEERSHIPVQPLWVALIRVGQVSLAIVILGLNGHAASVFGADSFPAWGVSFFTSILTLLFAVYVLALPFYFPAAYHYWAHIVIESINLIMWLVTWALTSAAAAHLNDAHHDLIRQNIIEPSNQVQAIEAAVAAAVLGSMQWILVIITYFMFGFALDRHRAAAGQSGFPELGFDTSIFSMFLPRRMSVKELSAFKMVEKTTPAQKPQPAPPRPPRPSRYL